MRVGFWSTSTKVISLNRCFGCGVCARFCKTNYSA
ncbi:hypothetical protein D5366_07020 [Neokomagataea tanensis]|uniref:4Fe-4S ferredoxin-type domain-containing protein n=1 Tax=Neokomagataea tanensis TaxID=661191 RepID=A0A4Y6V502_9PROT|nr:hypothetical protein D5366_07020 [Neokomagataea tanensis]